MAGNDHNLVDLRARIDDIDDALHDLIMQRAAIVARVGDAKRDNSGMNSAGYFRPGREAIILRRLLSRHGGSLPPAVIVRVWRELISAFVAIQGRFAVAVWDGEDGAYWDMARDHFGTSAPMTRHSSPRSAIQAVADGAASVGVLPMPHAGDDEPWWPLLDIAPPIRICALLPFVAGGNGRGGGLRALVVARTQPDPTGDDRTFLMIEVSSPLSRGRLTGALEVAGFEHSMILEHPGAGGSGASGVSGVSGGSGVETGALYLVEVEGYVAADDPWLDRLVEDNEAIAGVRTIGTYPVPPAVSGVDRR